MQGQIHADFYSNKILSLSPTAYWRLNESSGTTATDSSGNGNNGTYISSVGLDVAGAFPSISDASVNFPGSTSTYVDLGDNANLRVSNLTVSAWFKTDTVSGTHFIINTGKDWNDTSGYMIFLDGNDLQARVSRSSGDDDILQLKYLDCISTGTWYHVVLTFDDATNSAKLYLNGSLVQSNSMSSIYYKSRNAYIGKLYSSYYAFDGLIDELAIFDYALTPTQVSELYDTDDDGTGNASDTFPYGTDTDGDGVPNTIDDYPSDSAKVIDLPSALDISGLVLWLDASSDYSGSASMGLNGNYVERWYDLSGKGNNLIQESDDAHPNYVSNGLNSKGVVDFDGSDYLVALDDSTLDFGTGGFTTIVVFESDYDGYYGIIGKTAAAFVSGDNGWHLSTAGSPTDLFIEIQDGTGRDYTLISTDRQFTYSTVGAIRSGTTNYPYVNGQLQTPETSSIIGGNVSNSQSLYVGKSGQASAPPCNGKIAEVLVFNKALSNAELYQINYYLSQKWGLEDTMDSDNDGVYDSLDAYPTDSTLIAEIPEALDIGGLSLWVDADDTSFIVKDGSNLVSKIYDKSGNGNHALQSNATYKPEYVASSINGKNVINFDGSDDRLNCGNDSTLDLTTLTVFTVVKATSFQWLGGIVGKYHSNSANGYFFRLFGSSPYNKFSAGGVAGVDGTMSLTSGQPYIGAVRYGLTTNSVEVYTRGESATGTSTISSNTDDVYIGVDFLADPRFWNGDIGETIIFNKALSDDELYVVNYYLSQKWGLQDIMDSDGDGIDDSIDMYPTDNSRIADIPEALNITGLSLWIDPGDSTSIIKDGSNLVSNIYDKSGNGDHVYQTESSYKPVYNTTELENSSIYFDGQDDLMDLTNKTDISGSWTLLAVLKVADNTNVSNQRIIDSSTYSIRIEQYDNEGHLGYTKYGVDDYRSYLATSFDSTNIYSFTCDGSTITVRDLKDSDVLSINGDLPMDYIFRYFQGYVGDLIVYDSALSDNDRASVVSYLNTKWNLDPDDDGLVNDQYPADPYNNAANLGLPTSGLSLWLDANDPYGSGTAPANGKVMHAWYDKSGNGYKASQKESNRRPVFNSSVPALTFEDDVSDQEDYLIVSSGCGSDIASNGANGMTAFYVSKSIDNLNGYVLAYHTSTGGNLLIMGYNSTGAVNFYDSGDNNITIPIQQNSVYCAISDPNDDDYAGVIGHRYIYQDGYLLYKHRGISDLTSVGRVSLGQEWDGDTASNFLDGEISEVIIYNRILSDSERVQVSNYLANKWNSVALDTDADGLPDAYDGYPNDPDNNATALGIPTTNLRVWIDGDDPLGSHSPTDNTSPVDGAVLNRLVDKSGNGLHMYQGSDSGAGRFQTNGYIKSGKGCVDFTYHDSDSTNDGYSIRYPRLLDISNQATWIMVLKPMSNAHSHMVICNYDTESNAYKENGYYMNLFESSGVYNLSYSSGYSGNLEQIDCIASAYSPYSFLWTVKKDGSGLESYAYKNDGQSYLSSTETHPNTSSFIKNDADLRFGLGNNASLQYFEGYLGELLIFDAPLSQTELDQVHTYLNQKWNIMWPVSNVDTDGDRVPNSVDDYSSDSSKVVDIPAAVDHSGLVLWLDGSDADRMINSSSEMFWWFDKSGNQNSVLQSDFSRLPVYNSTGLNSLGTINFTGTDFLQLENSIDITSDWTVIAVTEFPKSESVTSWHTLVHGSASDYQVILQATDSDELGAYISGGPGFYGTGYKTATELNGWNIISAVGTGSITRFFVDDKVRKSVAAKSTTDFYEIGNRAEGDQPFGEIAEIFIYTRALSDQERRKVESYIINKWSLDKDVSADSNFFGF